MSTPHTKRTEAVPRMLKYLPYFALSRTILFGYTSFFFGRKVEWEHSWHTEGMELRNLGKELNSPAVGTEMVKILVASTNDASILSPVPKLGESEAQ